MAASRLRLRIAGGFAAVFAVALGVVALASVTYLRRESEQRLERRLARVVVDVGAGVERELQESPDSSIAFAAHEVVFEWPANGDAFVVLDTAKRLLTALDRDSTAVTIAQAMAMRTDSSTFEVRRGDVRYRAVAREVTLPTRRTGAVRRFTVVAFGSTQGIEEDVRTLGGALAVVAPLILLLSLGAGYLLAGRALAPVAQLGSEIAGIAPSDLSHRIPSSGSGDEVDRLAAEFNDMMGRLGDAQRRNQGFIREAAHQIRTPLTLVLGEAAHALGDAEGDLGRYRLALQRVGGAAEQMRRRVDELFLLAEAQSGEPVRLEDDVELDGLLLDSTDLMRGRAAALGRSLAIGLAEHITLRGNEALLREALLELLENGLRHGAPDRAVTASAQRGETGARIVVRSAGTPFILPPDETGSARASGLGLPIVRWIAHAHAGTLSLEHEGGDNLLVLTLPLSS
jgi:signal transduction histidine kinase